MGSQQQAPMQAGAGAWHQASLLAPAKCVQLHAPLPAVHAQARLGSGMKPPGHGAAALHPFCRTRAGSASSSSSLPIFCSACRPCLNSLSWRSTSVKRTDMAAAAAAEPPRTERRAAPLPVAQGLAAELDANVGSGWRLLWLLAAAGEAQSSSCETGLRAGRTRRTVGG